MSDADQPTLRDAFAMVALNGLLSTPHMTVQSADGQNISDAFAELAYKFADSMMKERAR